MSSSKLKLVLVLFVMFMGLVIRLWNLDGLPAEMWGDVIEGYKLTNRLNSNTPFYTYEYGGDGPLFFYLSSLTFSLVGPSFLSLKVTSALVGTLLIAAVFDLGRQYRGYWVGLTAATLMAVSKWSVIYSRMGKPHILSALLVVVAFTFHLKFIRSNKYEHAFLCSLFLGIGMYSQSAFWGAPLVVFIIWFINTYRNNATKIKVYKSSISLFFFSFLIVVPLISSPLVLGGGLTNPTSFFGEKMLFRNSEPLLVPLVKLVKNFILNMQMFHFTGSTISRDNSSPGSPVVDYLSGGFLILGIFTILKSKQAYLYLVPFVLFQVPSLLDINNSSLPNFGRTISIMPWTYLFVAIGLCSLASLGKSRIRVSMIATSILVIISISNLSQYFNDYQKHIPNSNIPFGRIIASKIDLLPAQFEVVVAGCCWGEGDDPHPLGIQFSLKTPRNLHLDIADPTICQSGKGSNSTYFIVDPRQAYLIQTSCPHLIPDQDITTGRYLVAKTFKTL